MSYSFTVGVNFITVVINGVPYLVERDTEVGNRVISLLKDGSSEEELYNALVNHKLKSYVNNLCVADGVEFTNQAVLIDGVSVSSSLEEQMRRHADLNIPVEPMVNFIRKLRMNPSYRIREQLWKFIEASENAGGFTIDADGDIIAYKLVRSDFKDIHSGTFDNSPGSIVEMPRYEVDDNPNNTCSSGLHFCAFSYLESYRHSGDDRIVLVKVSPADVVSIPTDYNHAKARCCRYEVLSEVNAIVPEPVYKNTCGGCEEAVFQNEYEDDKFDEIIQMVEEYVETFHPVIIAEAINLMTGDYPEDDLTEMTDLEILNAVLSNTEIGKALEDGYFEYAEHIFDELFDITHELNDD